MVDTLEEKLCDRKNFTPDERLMAMGEILVNMQWLSKYHTLREKSTLFSEANLKIRALSDIGHRFTDIGSQPASSYSNEKIHRMFCGVFDSYAKQFKGLPDEVKTELRSAYQTEYKKKFVY